MTGSTWLDGWTAAVNEDAENAHIGRFTRFTARLRELEGGTVFLRYDSGTVTAERGRESVADIELHGSPSAWRELVDPGAAPRRHDLLSLTKAPDGIEVVAGREHLLRHLRVITRLVEVAKSHE